MVQECINQQEVPGAVAILVKNGRIGYFKSFGFADIDSQKPMGKTAMFRIASMSKLITTVAALQLYERGHYHMETPLGSILPEFDQPEVFISWDEDKQTFQTEPARKKIRMKHLFTHTSGIVYPIFMDTSNVKIRVLAKVDTPIISAAMSPDDLATALRDKYKQFRKHKREIPTGA